MTTNETSQHDCDVLIAGAGPVGLTLAVELQCFGLSCRIIDRCAAPTDKSKALVVWPRTLELLDRAGIANNFVAAGMWAKAASMYGGGKRLVHVEIQLEESVFQHPLMIAQNETERLLNETLARRDLPVERSVELIECVDHGDRVESVLRHGDGREERVTSAWIAGCDGRTARCANNWVSNSKETLNQTIGCWPTSIWMARFPTMKLAPFGTAKAC